MTSAAPNAPFIGEWTLQSARFEFQDDGQALDIYGPEPTGRVIITPEGRFTVIITARDRGDATDAAALFRTMIFYSGDYVATDDKFTVRVDLSQHPGWVGSDQERFFKVDGDELSLWSSPMAHPAYDGRLGRSVFKWARAS